MIQPTLDTKCGIFRKPEPIIELTIWSALNHQGFRGVSDATVSLAFGCGRSASDLGSSSCLPCRDWSKRAELSSSWESTPPLASGRKGASRRNSDDDSSGITADTYQAQ